ncbi:MAG: hypothetical protein NTZ52_06475 [Chlamydiae bacterium]|nr:hypothetical protein [Chlamydiota bacterium]
MKTPSERTTIASIQTNPLHSYATYFSPWHIEISKDDTTDKIVKIAACVIGIALTSWALFNATHLSLLYRTSLTVLGGALATTSAASLFFFGARPLCVNNLLVDLYRPELTSFTQIDSSRLRTLDNPQGNTIITRTGFIMIDDQSPPPLIGKSLFIPQHMLEHLMRNKKDRALSLKHVPGDQITNMEGALHTFVTPLCNILMTGDYRWMGGYTEGSPFGDNKVRNMIMSACIQPDLEFDTVMMCLIKAQEKKVIGEPFEEILIPSVADKQDALYLQTYEEKLQKHMIYHLSSSHYLPAVHEIPIENIYSQTQTRQLLKSLITYPHTEYTLAGKFMRIEPSIHLAEPALLSLEILYETYRQQLRNEFRVLDQNTPQGYVYTIDPPSIFAATLTGEQGNGVRPAEILNRLQALAFQSLKEEGLFVNMKVLAFNNYADPSMPALLQIIFPEKTVLSKAELFSPSMGYQGPQGLALVIHNNSDGFGQNIQFEGLSSLDGVIGTYSNAACTLRRDRPDLVDYVF